MGLTEERLQEPLNELNDSRGVLGSAIVRRDGLMIAAVLPEDIDAKSLAAMTASTVGAGETAADSLNTGAVRKVIVEGEDGKLISTGVTDRTILTVLTAADIKMGLVLMEMNAATTTIEQILQQ